MKKCFLVFLMCMLVMHSFPGARAAQSQNTLTFVAPNGTEYLFELSEGGYYISCYKNENGSWINHSSGQSIGDYDPGFLRRHDTKSARPDGSFYPDDLGFDYVSSLTGAWDSYHFDGEYFSVSGWYDPAYNGYVMVKGLTLEYYPMGTSAPECVVTAEDQDTLSDWLHLERPHTPEMARACAAIQKRAVANADPGYTLYAYSAYSIRKLMADARYMKLENGMLYIKTVSFDSTAAPVEADRIPLPLSAEMLTLGEEKILSALTEYGE